MGIPILYAAEASQAVRGVLLTARAINLELEVKNVNLQAGEHLEPEFVKMNPQHTIPTLDDNGQIIWESHAICTYLIEKYANHDKLYPKDLYTRAKIHQRLHFDSSVLYVTTRACSMEVMYHAATKFPVDGVKELYSAYDFLEAFLANDSYLVGNNLTVADYCIVASVSTAQIMAPLDPAKCPKLLDWLKRMENISFYNEANRKGLDIYKNILLSKLEANKAAAGK